MRRSPLNILHFRRAFLMKFASYVKSVLLELIDYYEKNPASYVKNPNKDFVRNRKLNLSSTIKLIMSLSNKSSQDEILDFFNHKDETPSLSALIQQREKLSDNLFPTLLAAFNSKFPLENKHKGYQLLACDGSDINIFHNPNDSSTYYRNPGAEKGFNEIHLDALYDLCNRRYLHINIDGRHDQNEQRALVNFIDNYEYNRKTIFIADRNYCCWNVMAHAQNKGVYFLIRAKDIHSNGILKSFHFDNSTTTIDSSYDLKLVRLKQSINKHNTDAYRTMATNVKFDFLPVSTPGEYPISLRVVRFLIDDNRYEAIVTNLPQSEFSIDEIKELYSMRWGIETSFRELKHALALNKFHSKKVNHIHQEIFAKVIMYNFCSIITMHVAHKQRKKKHTYQINFSRAIKECRYFFATNATDPPDVETVIQKYMLPIRLGRTNPRKVKIREKSTFLYR